jgi:hypothetical protein
MRAHSLAASLLLSAMAASAQSGIVSLRGLRDTSRPLLIFAPSPSDPQLQIQLRTLRENAAAVAERDVVVIALPYQSPSPTPATLTDDGATAARRRFHVAPPDFTVILIGKDGGEKLRTHQPISLDTLRSTIDAMPMRQEEMRQKSSRPQ